jgi:hypothetical protein
MRSFIMPTKAELLRTFVEHIDMTQNLAVDLMQRQNRNLSARGTITRTVFNLRDDPFCTFVGSNDTGATDTDPTGGGAPGNNTVHVRCQQYEYGTVYPLGRLTPELVCPLRRFLDRSQHLHRLRVARPPPIDRRRNQRLQREMSQQPQLRHPSCDSRTVENLIGSTMTNYDGRNRVYQRPSATPSVQILARSATP